MLSFTVDSPFKASFLDYGFDSYIETFDNLFVRFFVKNLLLPNNFQRIIRLCQSRLKR